MADPVSFQLDAETLKALAQIAKFQKDATKALQGVEKQGEKSLGQLEKLANKANSSFASFKGNLAANLVTSGISLATNAIGSLVDLITTDAIASSQSYADSLLGVQNALELTGKATPETIKGLEDFAAAIQETTKFSDDAVLQSAAYIQTLGDLSGDGLQRATQAALDLSAALGKDLSTTTELVAKAATGNVAAFGKLGISIDKGRTSAETFEKTLAALESRFGGAAAKGVNSFTGATTQLKNAIESNLLKTIGDLIVRSPAVVGAIKGITVIVNQLTNFLSSQTAGKDFFRDIILGALDFAKAINAVVIRPLAFLGDLGLAVFNTIRLGLQNSVVFASTLGFAISKVLNAVGAISDETAQGFSDFRDSAIATSKDFANQVGGNLKSAFSSSEIADGISSAIDTISTSTAAQLDALPPIANSAGKKIKEALVLSDTTIEIGLKIGDPAAIQAAFAKSNELALIASQELNLGLLEGDLLFKELQLQQEIEFQQKITDARVNAATNQFTALSDNQYALLDVQIATLQEQLNREGITATQRQLISKRITDAEKKQTEIRANLANDFFSGLLTLSQGSNKELFEISKAAALANATVQGLSAINNGFATVPFLPLGLAMGAVAAVNTAIQIKQIAATKFQKGITEIPPGFNNDTFPALLTSGERVVDADTNTDLKAFLQNEQPDTGTVGGSEAVVAVLGQILSAIRSQTGEIVVNIGGREIIREVRDGLRAGGSLAV
jgi:hypothetical protein